MINRYLLESKESYREYTAEELRIIQSRDMERLRKMEGYCTTTKCLRGYILNYFGEQAGENCGNCSNCLEEFEEMDVSEAAADVVRCIRASGQRFGMNLIAGTLLGENTARIRSCGMNQNPSYGKQSGLGQVRVKEVIRTMMERGYLMQTADKYPVLRLTERSQELLEQTGPFLLRYKKEEEQSVRRKKAARMEELTEKGQELFEELRRLRAKLAGERSIPPYMVASDKTLRDMCIRIPLTPEEMLEVNGMGARKLEQYGSQFLEKIREVTDGKRDGYAVAEPEETVPLTEKKRKGKKEEFHLTEEILSRIQFVPETTISDFVSRINDLRDEERMKRLTIKWLTEHLLEEGCLEQRYQDGYTRNFLTEKGKKAGIRAEERISAKGYPYEIFLYSEEGQKHLVEILKQG